MVQTMRAVVRGGGCASCRQYLLRTFTTFAGVPLHTTPPQRSSPQARLRQRRGFSSTVKAFDLPEQDSREEDSKNLDDGSAGNGLDIRQADVSTQELSSETDSLILDAEISPADPSVPWYLQVDAPARESKALTERQKLPDLPADSPAILQPLLQQISVDLGLDDLTILDLRKLDPPPALGANLLMLIGTARSEKHLHVSADRLCRWLRSNYKLRPDADGLLGRNELKLKLKRKARRAKLMGNKEMEDTDDGVRTGWVCVNVGTVENSASSNTVKPDFIGFGRQIEGIKLVVQMMVEEKRLEMNLERLWTGISKRQSLLDDSAPEAGLEEPVPLDPAESLDISEAGRSDSIQPGLMQSPVQSSMQSRGYHTSARQCMSVPLSMTSGADKVDQPVIHLDAALNASFSAIEIGDYNKAKSLLSDNDQIKQLRHNWWRRFLLSNLKRHLQIAPTNQALLELGIGSDDQSSTPFLRCFFSTVSHTPSPVDWESRVWLQCFARNLKHPGYDAQSLSELLKSMHLSGCSITSSLWLETIKSILTGIATPPALKTNVVPHQTSERERALVEQKLLEHVTSIIQLMQSCGEDVMSEDVLVAIQEGVSVYPNDDFVVTDLLQRTTVKPENYNMPSVTPSPLQSRLNQLMYFSKFPIQSDEARIRLLQCHARSYDWETFWILWHSIARQGKPRSASLYAAMFRLVAEFRHQQGCMTVLRHRLQDMKRETPEVRLEDTVRQGVEACLRVADGDAEAYARNRDSAGEWIAIWRECWAAEGTERE